jgi:8-oxo-dGTP diphosphatase
MQTQYPIPCVGIIVLEDDKVLLIRRGKQPRLGEWSLPGGRQELGETLRQCAVREISEETGISILLRDLVEVFDMIEVAANGSIERHYTLLDYWAEVAGGKLEAGDDASEARWFALQEIGALGMWDKTVAVIHKAVQMRDHARAEGMTA